MGKITVAFNNLSGDKRLKTGWGLSLVVEQDEESFLFDTGSDAELLFYNLDVLGIGRNNIRKIVISHRHQDHIGGLERILCENSEKKESFLPDGVNRTFLKRIEDLSKRTFVVSGKKEILNHIYVLEVRSFFTAENVLTIETPKGLIVLVGCAHAGVLNICKSVKRCFGKNIYALLGGFHFEYYPTFLVEILGNLLKGLGIEIIAPNHCTGERAIKVLRRRFREGFLEFGIGKSFKYIPSS